MGSHSAATSGFCRGRCQIQQREVLCQARKMLLGLAEEIAGINLLSHVSGPVQLTSESPHGGTGSTVVLVSAPCSTVLDVQTDRGEREAMPPLREDLYDIRKPLRQRRQHRLLGAALTKPNVSLKTGCPTPLHILADLVLVRGPCFQYQQIRMQLPLLQLPGQALRDSSPPPRILVHSPPSAGLWWAHPLRL